MIHKDANSFLIYNITYIDCSSTHTIIFFKSMTSKQHKSTACINPSPMHHPAKNKWTFDHAQARKP